MKIDCSYDELVDIYKLQPNPKNNNKHSPEQVERLSKIIEYQGMRSPIIVSNRSGFIVKGHCRLEAVKNLKWDKAAVDYQDYESEAQEYADMTADNEIARWAELDMTDLHNSLGEINFDLDLELLGIEDFKLPEAEIVPECSEDEVPELKDDPITKRGDIWLLGEHRVMCGDSTMIDDVDKLMNGDKADMVFTDPPYGVGYSREKFYGNLDGKGVEGTIKNDDAEMDISLIWSYFTCPIFIWGANNFITQLPENGRWYCWDKRTDGINGKVGAGDGVIGSHFELMWSNKKSGYQKMYRIMHAGVKNADGDNIKRVHPTQKPIALAIDVFEFENSSDLIVDLFLGSGSTLIACEKTNRKCYGMELDEHYCDVIINRWQKFTGKDAVLESDNQKYNELKAGVQ